MTEKEKNKVLEESKKIENKRVPEDDIKEAIMFAKKYLEETDYIVIKLKEYELTNREITDDYSEVFKKREEAREIIRNFAQK